MDFNDIELRLKRIYASIDRRFDSDIDRHVDISITDVNGSSNKFLEINFCKQNQGPSALNDIMTIIDNIAKLKDHLKNIMKSGNLNPDIVEKEIDGSLELSIIIDLANKDKHGDPLTKSNRSKRSPRIENLRSGLRVNGRGIYKTPAITLDGRITGQSEKEGDCRVVLSADIVDEQGNVLTNLDLLIDSAMKKWEELIEKHGLQK